MIAYTVVCRMTDENKVEEWLNWLKNGHIDDVIAGGATDAQIIRLDPNEHPNGQKEHIYEVRYHFKSQDIFDSYLANHAPRLREDGLKRFPPENGFEYNRTMGTIIL